MTQGPIKRRNLASTWALAFLAGLTALTAACVGESKGVAADNEAMPRPVPTEAQITNRGVHPAQGTVEPGSQTPSSLAKGQGQRQGDPALKAFAKSLTALEQGQRTQVRILQLGDSHTASDRFSGHLRRLFQRDYGNAGRGDLPPGLPWRLFSPTQVSVTQDGAWQLHNSFNRSDTG
ncbi:MAG: hypothetical protein V2J20_03020, partial [Wenzhouxiangella sp.]|nr:hypothetical protein [Wenzhouxiangella sp.]